MFVLGRIVSFFAILASLVWLMRPDEGFSFTLHWGRLAFFLGSLASFVITETSSYKRRVPQCEKANPNDVVLLKKIFDILDPDRVVLNIRHQDFGGTFLGKDIDPLLLFADTWQGADKEFQDRAVELKHKKLVASAKELARTIANNTTPMRSSDVRSVVPDHLRNQQRPDWVNEDAKEINLAAYKFINDFDEFSRVARRRIPLTN